MILGINFEGNPSLHSGLPRSCLSRLLRADSQWLATTGTGWGSAWSQHCKLWAGFFSPWNSHYLQEVCAGIKICQVRGSCQLHVMIRNKCWKGVKETQFWSSHLLLYNHSKASWWRPRFLRLCCSLALSWWDHLVNICLGCTVSPLSHHCIPVFNIWLALDRYLFNKWIILFI